jgi:hypothetical protein
MHCVGQACSFEWSYLLLEGSVDDSIWDKPQSKMARIAAVLDGTKACIAVRLSCGVCRDSLVSEDLYQVEKWIHRVGQA